jgi:hypothetical protein
MDRVENPDESGEWFCRRCLVVLNRKRYTRRKLYTFLIRERGYYSHSSLNRSEKGTTECVRLNRDDEEMMGVDTSDARILAFTLSLFVTL